jgi:hypothetical protein
MSEDGFGGSFIRSGSARRPAITMSSSTYCRQHFLWADGGQTRFLLTQLAGACTNVFLTLPLTLAIWGNRQARKALQIVNHTLKRCCSPSSLVPHLAPRVVGASLVLKSGKMPRGQILTLEERSDGEPGTEVFWQDGPAQLSENRHSGGWCFSDKRCSILGRNNSTDQQKGLRGQDHVAASPWISPNLHRHATEDDCISPRRDRRRQP